MVDQNDAKSSHWPDTLCPGIRGRSSSPHGTHIQVTECSLMMSLSKSNCAKMMRRSLRKIVFGQLCELLGTNKPCAATIAVGFTPKALRKATLFFNVFSLPRIQTSGRQSGKAPIG